MKVFAPFGAWQMPGISKVEITNIERDEFHLKAGRFSETEETKEPEEPGKPRP